MKFAIAVLSHVVWLAGGTGSDMIAIGTPSEVRQS